MRLAQRKLACLLVILALMSMGCARMMTTPSDDFQRTELNILLTNKATYDKAFTALGLLYKAGKLSEETMIQASKYGNIYVDLHNTVVRDLIAGKPIARTAVDVALDVFLKFVAKI